MAAPVLPAVRSRKQRLRQEASHSSDNAGKLRRVQGSHGATLPLSRRRRRWLAAAGASALILALVAVLWPRRASTPSGGVEPSRKATTESGAPALEGLGSSAATDRQLEKDEVPMPGCWPGLHDFDRSASLDDMRAAIAGAGSRDPLLAGYLQERLAEMIGRDPARARQVLAWAKAASGAELEILMGAVKQSAAVRDPGVAEILLAMGEDRTAALDLRSRALDALETQQRLDAGTMGRMKAIALDETSDSAAWMATRTLGRVMKEDFERTGAYQPYWKQLLSIGRESQDTPVQLLALEMPSYADPVLDGGSIEALAELLRSDPDRSVREMAAHRLSVTRDPDRVLAVYRAAFPVERDECVRWAIFRFAARVAGAGALPLLARFAAIDPRFKEDHADFMTLYASGAVDFARIWLGKTERHRCLMEEGMEH